MEMAGVEPACKEFPVRIYTKHIRSCLKLCPERTAKKAKLLTDLLGPALRLTRGLYPEWLAPLFSVRAQKKRWLPLYLSKGKRALRRIK